MKYNWKINYYININILKINKSWIKIATLSIRKNIIIRKIVDAIFAIFIYRSEYK